MRRRHRGWLIDKATAARSVEEILADFFDRLGRVIPSRMGAGQPIEQAFNATRWARELEGDLLERPALARAIVERVERRLEGTRSVGQCRERLAELNAAAPRIAHLIAGTEEAVSPHVLYRLFTVGGALLYVGITDRGPRRWVEHARTKTWFGAVARFEIERCPTREAAVRREREAIEAERPIYNTVHNRARRAG